MPTLTVRVDGRTLTFDGSRVVTVGRSAGADVRLTAGSVSRAHAELRPIRSGWMLVDVGSQFGTFVDGDRVTEHRLTATTVVQCGLDSRGSTFSVIPEGASAPVVEPVKPPVAHAAAPPVPVGPGARSAEVPVVPTDERPTRPPGTPLPTGGYASTQVVAGRRAADGPVGFEAPRTGPDLLVVAEGREYRFRHPGVVRIGRQPGCEVVLDDPACSRAHGQVSAVPGAWEYTNHSTEGSFRDGRRVTRQRFDDRLELRLGHPVAGPAISLVPLLSAAAEERRIARRRRRRAGLVVSAVLVTVLVLVAAVTVPILLLGGDDEPVADRGPASEAPSADSSDSSLDVLTDEELERAKAATVLLSARTVDDQGRRVAYSGSGSIVSSDGLILTNAHVASPSAEGLAEYYTDDEGLRDPEFLLVALVDGMDDTPAEPAYRARLVNADGHLDAAVVRIYATADGRELSADEVAALDLPTMEVGDSDELTSGDDVTVLGFPGISGSTRLTVTTGVISTFIDRSDLGPRSEIDTDARIAPGNSGGAAINNDAEIIGIPSALFGDADSPVYSGRLRPINYVRALLEEAGVE